MQPRGTPDVAHRLNPQRKARELWAQDVTVDGSWISANDFPNEEAANLFVRWLEENDYAHQGVNGPHYSKALWLRLKETGIDSGERAWSVRFR